MIIRQDETLLTIDGDSFGVVTESKINADKLSKLFGLLSGIYKNIPASIVREYASNAWDANKMAGNEDKPIMVTLQREPDMKLIIKDFGTGMSPEIMTSIYFNYLDSTKEGDNEFIGGFGIGSKSALAYTHTFYIDTVYEGVLYKYIFSKQSSGIPAGELISQSVTEEVSGTTITVPIKNDTDLNEFLTAVKQQLMYFPNVFINGYGYHNNSYKLYEGNTFIYRTELSVSDLHMCIGNVYYPIDYVELGMDVIKVPVAIKFNIGELIPTPSRESIVYSKESIKKIKDKIKAFALEVEESAKVDQIIIKTLKDYEPFYKKDGYLYKISDDISINIPKEFLNNSEFFTEGVLNRKLYQEDLLKYLGLEISSDALWELRFLGWEATGKYLTEDGLIRNANPSQIGYWQIREKISNIDNNYYINIPNNYLLKLQSHHINPSIVYIVDKNKPLSDRIKNKYISDELSGGGSINYFIQYANYSLKDLKYILLKKVPKKNYRRVLEIIYELNSEYINSTYTYYNNIEVPQVYKDEYKKNLYALRKKVNPDKIETEISFECLEKSNSYIYTWVSRSAKPETILKRARNLFYVEKTDRQYAKEFQEWVDSTPFSKRYSRIKTFEVITMSKRNAKALNIMSLKEFIKSDSKLIKKLSTASRITKLGPTVEMYKDTIEKVSPRLHKLNSSLYDFQRTYSGKYCNLGELPKYIINITDINGNYDKEIISDAKEFIFYQNKLNAYKVLDLFVRDRMSMATCHIVLFNVLKSLNIPVNFEMYSNSYNLIK